MDKLQTIVRKLTGRQLTESAKEKAEKGYSEEFDKSKGGNLGERRTDKKFYVTRNSIVTEKSIYEYMKTPDVSYGWRIIHIDWYMDRCEVRKYTKEGLLKQKEISNNLQNRGLLATNYKLISYEPPGSFIGQVIRKW